MLRGWASADEAEADAYLVASNRLTIAGGWDESALAEMLSGVATTDAGLSGTGFAVAELDLLLAGQGEMGPTDIDAEWQGMPEFDQQDRKGEYATTVHFLTDEDAARFWKEVFGSDEVHRFAWWPARDDFEGGSDGTLAYQADE